jgi:3-hydroxyisobutyrate dehydrogenase-like beta-hydroxyacid dehydrogenase
MWWHIFLSTMSWHSTVIHYKTEDEMNRLLKARMVELSEKYEREISEADVVVICLKDYSGD